MRKGDAFRLGLAAVILIMSVAVFGYAAMRNATTAAPKQGESVYQYVIKEYNGNIAVYKSGEAMPSDIYEVPVETLPEEDVKSLETGIQVRDEEQLRRLLEDLTS